MTRKTFSAGLLAIGFALLTALQAAASGPATPLTVLYDPANGNIKLQNTLATTGSYQSIEILTQATNGGQGWLTGSVSNVPSPTPGFVLLNNSTGGGYAIGGQIAFGNIGSVMSGNMILSGNPSWNSSFPDAGPVGSFFDLGNVAVPGMTQAQLDVRFYTEPETSPNGQSNPGKFQVSIGTAPTTLGAVLAVNPVPEPSTYAMAFAGLATCGFSMWRRRRNA